MMIDFKNKRLVLVAGIVMIEVILTIVAYFVLPETIAVQITLSGGAGNEMPKIAGLAIPLILNILCSIMYYSKKIKTHLFFSILGIVMTILIFVFNM